MRSDYARARAHARKSSFHGQARDGQAEDAPCARRDVQVSVAKELLRYDADVDDIADDGCTALMLAAGAGHVDMVGPNRPPPSPNARLEARNHPPPRGRRSGQCAVLLVDEASARILKCACPPGNGRPARRLGYNGRGRRKSMRCE